jgi:hypothetical protein
VDGFDFITSYHFKVSYHFQVSYFSIYSGLAVVNCDDGTPPILAMMSGALSSPRAGEGSETAPMNVGIPFGDSTYPLVNIT